jgi:nucleoid-associated protein YgaU
MHPMSTTFATQSQVRFSVHLPARAVRPAPTVSTYRRRRVGAAAFVITLVVSVGSMAQRGLADHGGDPASAAAVGQHATYVVHRGDTLWSIAERLYPNADVALVVDALVSLNGGSSIDVGQALNMP